MSLSHFDTPSPITVDLDLYVADVRFTVSDRADTIVEVRPTDPEKAADNKAADNTRVDYDEATQQLRIVSKRRTRSLNFSGKRPESIDVVVQLPTGSAVRGEAGVGDLESDGALGPVAFKTGLGVVRLAETGTLRLRSGLGGITVDAVHGAAEVHSGSSDIRIGAVEGTADVSTGNGKVWIGVATGAASVKTSNGSAAVDRALSDITATSSNGEVRFGEVVRGRVSATSKNGSVDVGVREGSAAWLELATGAGRVYNELASSDEPAADDPADRVEVRAGTKLGDVTVRRVPLDR